MINTKRIEYKDLPEDIRSAIESTAIDEAVEKIAQNFNLHVDQSGVVYEAANSILLGRMPPSNFVSMLTKEGKIDETTSLKIAREVNEKIFLAVRESLKKIHGVGGETPRETAPLEQKQAVLQAIETPEAVPMRARVVEESAPDAPKTAPEKPEAPEQARIVPPTPEITKEAPVAPAAPETPKAAPTASAAGKGFDPYREPAI